ncbi:hypothetical protein FOA52_013823 [Chlamydomonas sp. UWO 241]|nr:hypothetical protein FOA52_013823 [Chlamydomonas sp. UWO 241]
MPVPAAASCPEMTAAPEYVPAWRPCGWSPGIFPAGARSMAARWCGAGAGLLSWEREEDHCSRPRTDPGRSTTMEAMHVARALSHAAASAHGGSILTAWAPMARAAWGVHTRDLSGASASSSTEASSPTPSREEAVLAARERIFGPTPSTVKDGTAVLARKLKGPEIASWYFMPPTEQPGAHNEERAYVQARSLNRRPPKAVVEAAASTKKKKKK